MEKQLFIQGILESASKEAEIIKATASKEAEVIFANAEEEKAAIEKREKKKLDDFALKVQARKSIDARMKKNEILLDAKQKAMDGVVKATIAKVIKMPSNEYIKWLGALIASQAKDNDAVVLAKADKTRLPKDFIESLAKSSKINIKPSNETHEYSGGVLLCGATYDKNLTLENLFTHLAEKNESEISKVLFN